MSWIVAVLAGLATGVLSGFGVGGGTLLLVYMTQVAGLDQHLAQGVNLLYFLPAALMALPGHAKHGYIEKKALLPAIGGGLVCALPGVWAASVMDTQLLGKCFGVFLVVIGARELLSKEKQRTD